MRSSLHTFYALIIVAACLALAACGGIAARSGGTVMVISTPSPTPAHGWRTVAMPEPGNDVGRNGTLDVSQADGRLAWLCVEGPERSTVWASTDAGRTWHKLGTITQHIPIARGFCLIHADLLDPKVVTANIFWGELGNPETGSVIVASRDGGMTWAQVPGGFTLGLTATANGKTYSLDRTQHVEVSADGLKTWRTLGPAALPTTEHLSNLWVSPSGTDLLAASGHTTLWHSTDSGATWGRIRAPDETQWLARWLPASAQWMICGHGDGPSAQTQCNTGLGTAWEQHDALRIGGLGCPPGDILPDGALFTACSGSNTERSVTLYVQPPHSATWAAHGPGPDIGTGGTSLRLTTTGQVWHLATNPGDPVQVLDAIP